MFIGEIPGPEQKTVELALEACPEAKKLFAKGSMHAAAQALDEAVNELFDASDDLMDADAAAATERQAEACRHTARLFRLLYVTSASAESETAAA